MRARFELQSILVTVLILSAGCQLRELDGGGGGGSSGGDGGSGTTPVGSVDDTSFSVTACKQYSGTETSGTCTPGNHILHRRSSATSALATNPVADRDLACEVTEADYSSAAMINCMVEADELELGFNGIALNFNVPSDMCEYVRVTPFYFWNYLPALSSTSTAGPQVVRYSTTDSFVNASTIQTETTVAVLDATDQVTTNSAGTGIRCLYDYTNIGGPNCCEGPYTAVVTATVSDPAGGPGTTTTVTQTLNWGGKAANCLAGPGVRIGSQYASGVPAPELHFVSGTGINRALVAFEPSEGDIFPHTAFTANWVSGAAGAADLGSESTLPAAFRTFANVKPNIPYEFACLDRDADVKARIQVFIREWNEFSELEDYANGVSAANPDTSGNETSPSNPSEPINDYDDWDNLITSLGIASAFPRSLAFDQASSGGGALMSSMVPGVF